MRRVAVADLRRLADRESENSAAVTATGRRG